MTCALLELPAPPLGAWHAFDEYVDNYLSEHSDFLNEECAQQAEWLAYASGGAYSIDAELAAWHENRVEEIRSQRFAAWIGLEAAQAEITSLREQLNSANRKLAIETKGRAESEENETLTQQALAQAQDRADANLSVIREITDTMRCPECNQQMF